MLLLVIGSLVLVAATLRAPSSGSAELTYGVSRTARDPGIAIHWVLCPGVRARTVDLGGYVGGSQPPTAVPILWQIRSDAAPAAEPRVVTFTVGRTPPGYYETVRYGGRLPDDLIVINSPPGGADSMHGMSFELADLPREGVYRGTYETVSTDQFIAEGLAACPPAGGFGTPALWSDVALLLIGAGGVLLAGRARPTVAVVAATIAVVGTVGLLPISGGEPLIRLATTAQPRDAFGPGAGHVPDDRQILANLSPATLAADPAGSYVARIVAPGPYAFVVRCAGRSLQIGEGSGIENGVTGGRQVIGCATAQPVRGLIAERRDRSELVEIVVNPNGIDDWRVVVIEGPGAVGPYDEG